MQSKLALRAMTLHGIGSYLRGTRLEIRPITILCGENGSGKSTWFKTLNMLRESQRLGMLPFSFDVGDSSETEPNDIPYTNAFVHLDYDDKWHAILNAAKPQII